MRDKRVKNVNGLNQIMIDIKPNRCDSDVYINQKIDVTNLVEYMEKIKKNNKDLTYFHAFMTALGILFYNRKKLNYYVRNRHLYEHKDIVISFVAKISFDDKSEEVMLLIPISKDDNIFKVHPISHINLIGYKVPNFDKCINMVCECAKIVPDVKYVGWDVAITKNGVSLIEGNCYPGIYQIKPSFVSKKCGLVPIYEDAMKIRIDKI